MLGIGPVHEREKKNPAEQKGGQREDSVDLVKEGMLLL